MAHDRQLDGMTVAIVVSDLFEQVELTEPKRALEAAGAKPVILSPKGPWIHGMHHDKRGDKFQVDADLEHADPTEYDGVVICHGAWLLVSAGIVQGRLVTSWPSLQDDIRNAGGTWVDRDVVVDGHWISSRKPADLPVFTQELVAALARAPEIVPPMPLAG
jgi:protease I